MLRHLTCAGVSVSLIGWPSNRNLICLIWRPWEKQHSRQGGDSSSKGFNTRSVRLNRALNPPVVHSKPSWVCWVVYAFWFWTEPQNHPALQPWGWCDHSRSLLPPAETNTVHEEARLCKETDSTKFEQRLLYYKDKYYKTALRQTKITAWQKINNNICMQSGALFRELHVHHSQLRYSKSLTQVKGVPMLIAKLASTGLVCWHSRSTLKAIATLADG